MLFKIFFSSSFPHLFPCKSEKLLRLHLFFLALLLQFPQTAFTPARYLNSRKVFLPLNLLFLFCSSPFSMVCVSTLTPVLLLLYSPFCCSFISVPRLRGTFPMDHFQKLSNLFLCRNDHTAAIQPLHHLSACVHGSQQSRHWTEG